jgi:hypothetical protein
MMAAATAMDREEYPQFIDAPDVALGLKCTVGLNCSDSARVARSADLTSGGSPEPLRAST